MHINNCAFAKRMYIWGEKIPITWQAELTFGHTCAQYGCLCNRIKAIPLWYLVTRFYLCHHRHAFPSTSFAFWNRMAKRHLWNETSPLICSLNHIILVQMRPKIPATKAVKKNMFVTMNWEMQRMELILPTTALLYTHNKFQWASILSIPRHSSSNSPLYPWPVTQKFAVALMGPMQQYRQ